MAKYVRYDHQGAVRHGQLEGGTIQPLEGDFGAFRPAKLPTVALDAVKLLAPTTPSKIIAIGPNFNVFFRGPNAAPPMELTYWTKPASVLNHPDGVIELPPGVPAVNHEVELAIVIGKRARQLRREQAREHIFGFTCMNDVTAGDFATPGAFPASPYFAYGKIFDGFGPLGPWIVTGLDTSDLHMETRVNGQVRQSHSTSDMIHDPEAVVARVSNVVTLEPGDVISMGSPPGVAPIVDGDVVEIEIEGVGVLRNYARDRPRAEG
jgi:2-keto-4-pentenoate hydratase/2-oxohepta-3-ene-1,7-dioic acid hydratase in catechol pathway